MKCSLCGSKLHPRVSLCPNPGCDDGSFGSPLVIGSDDEWYAAYTQHYTDGTYEFRWLKVDGRLCEECGGPLGHDDMCLYCGHVNGELY